MAQVAICATCGKACLVRRDGKSNCHEAQIWFVTIRQTEGIKRAPLKKTKKKKPRK